MRKEVLEIRCGCGHYNVVPSLKIFLKFRVLDEKQGRVIKGLLPAYKISDTVRCEKCGKGGACRRTVQGAGNHRSAREEQNP